MTLAGESSAASQAASSEGLIKQGARSAGSAADFVEASSFRSFAAVKDVYHAPPAAVEDR
jgi:hypothetical protein